MIRSPAARINHRARAHGYQENDTVAVDLPRTPESKDPNPFYGRVVYTHGLWLDQPLGITRIGYVDFKIGTPRTVIKPFTVSPGWSVRGDPDRQYIADSTVATCPASGATPCVQLEPVMRWWPYAAPARLMNYWYGTLIEHKADRTGTFYRRNRYYDQATGRFTQEDPIGLAGGVNVYGYAGGDPVNFSDPFGLKVCYEGRPSQVRELRRATEAATGTSITLDDSNCIERFMSDGRGGFEELQLRLTVMIESDVTHWVMFGTAPGGPVTGRGAYYDGRRKKVIVGPNWLGSKRALYPTRRLPLLGCIAGRAPGSYASLIAHELLGHALFQDLSGFTRPSGEWYAARIQNLYHAAVGQPLSCVD